MHVPVRHSWIFVAAKDAVPPHKFVCQFRVHSQIGGLDPTGQVEGLVQKDVDFTRVQSKVKNEAECV